MVGTSQKQRRLRTPAVLPWLRLVRVFQQVSRRSAEQFRCWGLTPAQFDALAQVGAAEGRTQQELADALLVTKGNVTQLLDRMEQCGLLQRRQEGRTKRLFLTEHGRALRDQVVPAHEALISEQFSALTPEEQRALQRLLRKLDRSLQE
ncbi:MAG: MarR family winged helix-turn-helix transcriptional regulator [Chloroflexota bacterium]